MTPQRDAPPGLNQPEQAEHQPMHIWMPSVVLKFLVFVAFAFVIFEATAGLGAQDIPQRRLWAIIAGMVGLLLLLAIDRLTGLRVSATGVEATLSEMQAQALDEVGALENKEAVEAAREQILQAKNPAQVETARAMAVKLNMSRVMELVQEAISKKRKLYVRYRTTSDRPVDTYTCIPLDVKPGETNATKTHDYLWIYSEKHGHVLSLRLERVQGVELSGESFDPAEAAKLMGKAPEWNLPRDW